MIVKKYNKIINQIVEKDELILWKMQESKLILDSIIIGILIFINLLFIVLFMINSNILLISIFLFSLIIFLVMIIISLRDYSQKRQEDQLKFISNRRICIVKILQDSNIGLDYAIDQIRKEDITKIMINYKLKLHSEPTITFFSRNGETFQFVEVKKGFKFLRKVLIENLNVQSVEKISNDTEVIIIDNH